LYSPCLPSATNAASQFIGKDVREVEWSIQKVTVAFKKEKKNL